MIKKGIINYGIRSAEEILHKRSKNLSVIVLYCFQLPVVTGSGFSQINIYTRNTTLYWFSKYKHRSNFSVIRTIISVLNGLTTKLGECQANDIVSD